MGLRLSVGESVGVDFDFGALSGIWRRMAPKLAPSTVDHGSRTELAPQQRCGAYRRTAFAQNPGRSCSPADVHATAYASCRPAGDFSNVRTRVLHHSPAGASLATRLASA